MNTARRRRKLHLTLAAIWLGPGAGLSVIFPRSLWWIVFMSWFANVYTCVSALSAETPVEEERP